MIASVAMPVKSKRPLLGCSNNSKKPRSVRKQQSLKLKLVPLRPRSKLLKIYVWLMRKPLRHRIKPKLVPLRLKDSLKSRSRRLKSKQMSKLLKPFDWLMRRPSRRRTKPKKSFLLPH